jgi:hypothetical protein
LLSKSGVEDRPSKPRTVPITVRELRKLQDLVAFWRTLARMLGEDNRELRERVEWLHERLTDYERDEEAVARLSKRSHRASQR